MTGVQTCALPICKNISLYLVSRSKHKLLKLKKLIIKQYNNSEVIIIPFNMEKKFSDKLLNFCKKKLGLPNILINNSGGPEPTNFINTNDKMWEKTINRNLISVIKLSTIFSKSMIKNRWGRIINIGSSSSYQGFLNGSIYVASKFAILGISRTLHDELKEYGVRTCCISPSSIKTEMSKLSKDQDYSTFLDPKEVAEFVIFQTMFDDEMVVEESRLNRMFIR